MDLGLEIELYIGGLSRRGREIFLKITLTSSLIEKVTRKIEVGENDEVEKSGESRENHFNRFNAKSPFFLNCTYVTI